MDSLLTILVSSLIKIKNKEVLNMRYYFIKKDSSLFKWLITHKIYQFIDKR